MRMRRPARPNPAAGQAMIEFVIAAMTVLGVLFLGMAMLGKFSDVRNKALMASRYAGWERTVWTVDPGWRASHGSFASKGDEEIRSEFVQRVLGHDQAALASSDRSARRLPGGMAPMWKDHAGLDMLRNYADVTLGSGVDETPAATLKPITAAMGAANAVSAGFDLATRNLYRAEVGLSVAGDNAALRALWPGWTGFGMQDHTVLLTNAWTPEGRNGTLAVIKEAVPTSKGGVIDTALTVGLAAFGPEILQLDLGRIQPDVVPADRLGSR